MLILTRKMGESILIGDDIEITITSIDQNKVRVGIKGPSHIPIYREEIYRKIQRENRAAALIGKDEFESLLDIYAGGQQGDAHAAGLESGKS
jgi:carbon storage regulator